MSTTIGFLGLGGTGFPMAANLVAAGFGVRARNRSPEKAAALTGGPDGILAGLAPASVHIGMSTISVAATRRLARLHADQGCGFIAAPVFGRPEAAKARQRLTEAIRLGREGYDIAGFGSVIREEAGLRESR